MIRIFIEGGEQEFLDTYLKFLFGENNERWEFISAKGYTNLHNIDQQFLENTDRGGENLIIFDADSPSTGGGVVDRTKYLEDKLSELSLSASIFLLPNNSADGDYESLLVQIVNEEHRCLLDCFDGYECCVGGYQNPDGSQKYVTPNRKAKVYAYIESFKRSGKVREEMKNGKRFFIDNSEYWNLNSPCLDPLKEFLMKYIH